MNHPQTETKTCRAQSHKKIELLTQAADGKQNIKRLNFQEVPEEINKANKSICFSLCNPLFQQTKWPTKDEVAVPKNPF